jgi:sialidase-1
MRSYAGQNRRAVARSHDRGLSWTRPELEHALVEPVCQASLIRAGKALLFSNPASEKRVSMTVKASDDLGRTWRVFRTVHAGPSAYSNLVELKQGIGLLYERGERGAYEEIAFATMPRP